MRWLRLFGEGDSELYVVLQEFSGRIIRVELAKSFKKLYSTLAPTITPKSEARNWIYVSNLAWNVRSGNLREFFAAKFKPVSARVVFNGPSGGSAGYGFVSFATNEEAVTAISELDEKELMRRPLRLKISQKDRADEPNTSPEG
ncbi:33 kDa ribonucleoprotein, chloroplastic-like isoform X1 [Phalaenopsis equestris]|uniref:33 kDa ribonucleoprotein, chloroplastic-like isoform X1 n=1 Tax=Phalaenopsis equestris TaxID=78828 RepID=UPI0009E49D27|nr:33 kDa ribonucleoprotein, chloroplastic-like isoform X1 [Phalaenopsis equestris]